MGSSISSISKTLCDESTKSNGIIDKEQPFLPEAPPELYRPASFDEKMYDKFRKQPLVPIGCAATAYFLISGIRSFQKRDPMRAQKMMRARVGAQFATLATFVYYVGLNNVNFEVAPQYYRQKAAKEAAKSSDCESRNE